MPADVPARVLAHEAINPDHRLLTLEAPRIARAAKPGQFVMLQVAPGHDPLLRRPMSLCRVPDRARRRIEVLYKIVGEGTRALATRRPGDTVMTLGPLGNGFTLPRAATGGAVRRGGSGGRGGDGPVVMVAGGIGIAIFPFLADELQRAGQRTTLLFGARGRSDLVYTAPLRGRGVTIRYATEDGSRGARGFVTTLLEPLLAATPRPRLYVCGPTPMLRAVGELAAKAGAPCQLALESQMPCGIGVCLGCVVACPGDANGPIFRRVCTEGPIFTAGQVSW
jgi:dihydroorotate dehydrogenase electron transfer subunit